MIVAGKAMEPKVSSASGIYLAVVTGAESNVSKQMINVSFYCPATMTGHPLNSVYNGSSVVVAPVKPHNGENVENYNFTPGAVISISYEDGDLNTPQFVNFITDNEDTVKHNLAILQGASIPMEEMSKISYESLGSDWYDSPVLKKAIALLKALRICASGNEKEINDYYYSIILGDSNFLANDIAITKVGAYGTEFICNSFPDNGLSGDYIHDDDDPYVNLYNSWDFTSILTALPEHKPLNIFRYLCTSPNCSVKPENLVKALESSSFPYAKDFKPGSEQNIFLQTQISRDLSGEPTALKSNLNKINENLDVSEANNENIADCLTEDGFVYRFYKNIGEDRPSDTYSTRMLYRRDYMSDHTKSFWGEIYKTYNGGGTAKGEFNKIYSSILTDNLYDICVPITGDYNPSNISLVITALVATAHPLIEGIFARNETTRDNWEDDNKKFWDTMQEYITKNKPVSDYKDSGLKKEIGDGFAKIYVDCIKWGAIQSGAEKEDIKNAMSDRIVDTITYLVDNWDSGDNLNSILSQTIDSNGSDGSYDGDAGGLTGDEALIWNLLYSEFKNEYIVAGIMGNMMAESGMRSNNLDDTRTDYTDESFTQAVDNGSYSRERFMNDGSGYGLVQFTWWTLKRDLYDYAKQQGKSISDINVQVHCIIEYMKESGLYDGIKKAGNSVKATSDYFLLNYEKPADQSESMKARRASFGQTIYDKWKSGINSGAGGSGFAKPCDYKCISSPYGPRWGSFHNGIDLANDMGTPIYASQSGTVTIAHYDSSYSPHFGDEWVGNSDGGGYGNYIYIDHDNGITTIYAHLKSIAPGITKGSAVSKRQLIGYMDSTGSSTGSHLHFGMMINGSYVDPASKINF